MPELPEVEVIRRALLQVIPGRLFARPLLFFPGSVRYPAAEQFCRLLAGCRVEGLQRRGKYLIIELNSGQMVIHLRMTGNLIFSEDDTARPPHLRLLLPFAAGGALCFSDLRKFGGIWLLPPEGGEPPGGLNRLGPDIYEELDKEQFERLFERRSGALIKPLLLDQSFVAGLGNIYVDESLFRCGINPRRRAASLSRGEIDALYQAIRATLEEGISRGGASVRDFRGARGEGGTFQHHLAVYNRCGLPCRRCGAAVMKIKLGGRGSYYCPHCQQEK